MAIGSSVHAADSAAVLSPSITSSSWVPDHYLTLCVPLALVIAKKPELSSQAGRRGRFIEKSRCNGQSSTRTFPQRILHIRAFNELRGQYTDILSVISTSHQKVVAEIDFSGSLWGYTEITITPTSSDLKTIYLNSRHSTIHSVHVGSYDADFSLNDPISNISIGPTPEDATNSHYHHELKRKLFTAFQEGDDGELAIAIPQQVSLKHTLNPFAISGFGDFATPEPQTPGVSQPQNSTTPGQELANLVIKITYSFKNPPDGIEFVLPNDSHPYRAPHAYTTPSSPDAARCWVPCFDSISEKCTWEFEFVVPRYLEEIDQSLDEEPIDLSPTLVICSGELVEQVAHPYNSHKTIFTFSQAVLTSVQHIAWAAGPFHLLNIPPDNSADETSSGTQPPIHVFCLPGHEAWLSSTTSVLRPAMTSFTSEYHSYPFGSYKVVFVEELPVQRFDSSTLALITVDLLHGDDAIEQAIEVRQILSHALACQWAGISIQPKAWADIWLVNGLALYMTGLFLKKLFGVNEYRFRMKKDMQRVLERDNGTMPPICQPSVYDPPDPSVLPFIDLKAPLVLHLLDRRLGKSGTSLGLSRVLPKIFLSAISGEMVNNVISTHSFLRTCRKVSGVDLRTFAEQWIYGSGCPAFGVSATFNRKKMAVEITMRQESPAYKALEQSAPTMLLMKPVAFFEGTMTIRIHEADGTPYEHVLDIRSPFKRYEVPFNTKYKRVRRNTKRYLARQAAAQAAAEGDADAAEAMGMVDMGFGLDIWEKEKERENWKVADWTEDDENMMSGATYEWIRMDADFEWIANLNFEQPDFMWVSQLQRDRDVVAQLEAVHALSKQPTAIVSSTLTKTVLVSNYHYRIRCEAASALVQCAIRKLDFLGLFHLFKLFLRYCYEPEDPNQDLFTHTYVPKANDFSDLSEYFLRKTLVVAISKIRFENGKSPSVVRQFLIDQLKYNDNTANPYSDAFYICTLITAAACATVSTAAPERGELLPSEVRSEHNAEDQQLLTDIIGEIERYKSMDRLIPSTHNIVTIAVLEFYLILGVAGLAPNTQTTFFTLTRYGNYTQVRIAAFDGLFLTKWYTPEIMRYILAVMCHDPSRVIRRHVARSACQSFAILVQMGEIKAGGKENESLLIEEDGSLPEKSKEAKKNELDAMIRALRKEREVGKNDVLRAFLIAIAMSPNVDYEVRWAILKIADMLIRPVAEEPPKFSLHIPLPPTPVTEMPPPLPKLSIKPQRKASAVPKPAKSPLIPVNLPTKVKLSNGVSTRDVQSPRPSPALPTLRLSTPIPPPKKSASFSVPAPAPLLPTKPKPKGRPPTRSGVAKTAPAKGQSAGMTITDLKAARNAFKKVRGNKHARMFLQPVDPIRDHAPNYFDVIKDPMDLGTIGAKLDAGMYKDRFAFQADFRLMIANAKQYNAPGSFVHNAAISLEVAFDKQWSIITKTLEAADKSHIAHTAPDATPSPVLQNAPPPRPRVIPPIPKAKFSPPPAKPSNPPRPSIKLKLGTIPPVQKEKSKSKPRPPKVTIADAVEDLPPPPYVDDGSADLLEEVLAIEREKDEEKQRTRQVRVISNGPSTSKRKNRDLLEDDALLELASPAKKEKSSGSSAAPPVASSSRIVIPAPRLTPIPKQAPSPAPKGPTPVLKIKRDKGKAAAASPVPTPVPTPAPSQTSVARPSLKGKEREAVRPSREAAPSKPKASQTGRTPINVKKCRDLMKTIQKLPEAALFARPVDPVIDGCHDYFDEIHTPMDFGTMLNKLGQGAYTTMEAFKADFDLTMSNCLKYNPATTSPHVYAKVVQGAFEREWPKLVERKLSWAEKRGMQGILTSLVKEQASFIFWEPVDPVLLGIPTYFDIIPKKNARDLRTIRAKLDADQYEDLESFEADMALMINNAITFNGAESEAGVMAVEVQRRYKELLGHWKSSQLKKRKDGDKGTPQPNKKAKIA